MLQAMLLAGLVAAPLGSLALFVPIRRHARRAGTWPAIRRLVLAVLGTVVLAAAVVVTLRLLSASRHNLIAGVAAVVFASLVWMPVTRRWSARAHLCWASTVFLFVVFLIYALEWTFDSHLGLASTVGGVLLWLLEVFAAILSCACLWEICDALGTEHWRRRITPTTPLNVPDRELPLARAARGRDVRPRDHAADVRGAQGPALPLVLRRHPDPAHALALDDARAQERREPPGRLPALGLPGRRRAVVRRPAQPAVLHLPAGRRGQPGHRRRPVVP